MSNISMSFLDLTKEEQKKVVNKTVQSICAFYCCRENCDGCFIAELLEESNKTD